MKKFLINILNSIGLGVNGVMVSPEFFQHRLEQNYGHLYSFERVNAEDGIVFIVTPNDGSSRFGIAYKLDGKRIIDVDVNE